MRIKDTVLALDIGSSSVRASIFNTHLEPLMTVSHKHQFDITPAGASTMDMKELQARVETCLDAILAHPTAQRIMAFGMATFASNLLGVNAQGAPITPVYSYADTRCAPSALKLAQLVDEKAIQQRTGCRLHSAYHPARLHWLGENGRDDVWQWLDIGTYLYQCWFGRKIPCSISIASWSGLLNRETGEWDAQWLAILGLQAEQLPAISDYDNLQVDLTPIYAERWPALKKAPFCLAVGDGAAAHLGSGAQEGQIALTLGTTGALRRTIVEQLPPLVPIGLWSYRVDKKRHVIGGATSEGGNIYAWLERLGLCDEDVLQRIATREPLTHGLTILPLLAGERSPGWRADAVGTIHGLRLSTTAVDIAQAFLEAIALRLAVIAEALAPANAEPIIGGGGALSPLWAQIIADALEHPLAVLADTEMTARGVAQLALSATGNQPLGFSPPIARTYTPRLQYAPLYRAARQRQQALYARLGGDNPS